MNNEVYQLRRKVIDILYQAKDFDIKLVVAIIILFHMLIPSQLLWLQYQ